MKFCLDILKLLAGIPEGKFVYVAVGDIGCDGKKLQKYADHTQPLGTFTSIDFCYLRDFHCKTQIQ